MRHTIYLVGARAAGKTTFGGALARQLGCNYVDTDIHLRETTGETVADIVAREGWDGFRKRESAVLRAVTAPGTVIATGGGMVLAEENRRFMRENGIVLYLSAPAEVLASRLQANPNAAQRPTLTGKSIAEEVAEVLAAREPLYRETATHILNPEAISFFAHTAFGRRRSFPKKRLRKREKEILPPAYKSPSEKLPRDFSHSAERALFVNIWKRSKRRSA